MTQVSEAIPTKDEERMESMSGFEFARKDGESDEDWAAACRDMARALAKATGTEHLLPNASIQVSELLPCPFCGGEMVIQGQLFRHAEEPPHGKCAIRQNAWATEMRDVWNTRQSLPQGDEAWSPDEICDEAVRLADAQPGDKQALWRAAYHGAILTRAALVRSPIGDDVREAIQFALDELKPMPRLLSQWAGGMGKQITAVRTRLRKATTAIGSQSIEGERG